MERRDFMKMCSVAGLGLAGVGLSGEQADAAPFEGKPLLIVMNKTGGMDCTHWFNPMGNVGATPDRMGAAQPNADGDLINDWYTPNDIRSAGANGHFKYAPPDIQNNLTLGGLGVDPRYITTFNGGVALTANECIKDLLARVVADRVLVIRGIDTTTNSHDNGQANTFSGRTITTTACLMALYASYHGKSLPLAFVDGGGYAETAGSVSRARLNDLGSFQALIYPNRTDPGDPNSPTYLTDKTLQRVAAMRQDRLERLQKVQNLPKLKARQGLLWLARSGVGNLKLIEQYLEPNAQGLNGAAQQASIILAAYLAGLTVAGSMSTGGFDVHGAGDLDTAPNFEETCQGILHLFFRAMELEAISGINIIDNMYFIEGSEFGRTPYNGNPGGKDHSSHTTMMFMGPGITGGRTINASAPDNHVSLPVDPATMQVGVGDVTITPGHIHKWLRKVTGIEEGEFTRQNPITQQSEIYDFNMG